MAARKKAAKKKATTNGVNAHGFTVVVEEIRGQFKVFGEALQGLSDKVTAGFADVDRRFEQVDRRFEQVDRDLGLVKAAILDHGRELKELRGAVETLAATKVDRDEVAGIVERVVAAKSAP